MTAHSKKGSVTTSVELRELSATESTALSLPIGRSKKTTLLQAVRQSPRVVGWSFALTSAVILSGFDISIISSVASLPQFQREFGQAFEDAFIIPALWLGLWNAGVPLGAIAGSLFGGFFQDRAGRRWSVVAASLLSACCVAVAYTSDLSPVFDTRRGIFLVAKTLQGFANGMILVTAETYLSELLPPGLRGPGLALFPIFTLVGQLAGSVVVQTSLAIEGPRSYRVCFASQWPFTALPLVVGLLMPESPPWLIRIARLEAAFKSHVRLETKATKGGRGGAPESERSFQALQDVVRLEEKRSRADTVTYMQCFKGVDLRRTIVVVLATLLPNLFGLPLFATASYYLQTIGMDAGTSVIFIIIGVVLGLVANIAAFWTLTTFGRRTLILGTLGVSVPLWVSVGIAGCFTGPVMIWYVSICMMIILLIVGLGAWPASYVVGAETSSLRLRARTQGIAGGATNLITGAFSIVLPYMYNPDQGRLGGRVGFVFAVFCTIGVGLVWRLVPEMKDRTASEIDEMFELGLETRKFKSWRGEGTREIEEE